MQIIVRENPKMRLCDELLGFVMNERRPVGRFESPESLDAPSSCVVEQRPDDLTALPRFQTWFILSN